MTTEMADREQVRAFHRELCEALNLPFEHIYSVAIYLDANSVPRVEVKMDVPNSALGVVLSGVKRYDMVAQ